MIYAIIALLVFVVILTISSLVVLYKVRKRSRKIKPSEQPLRKRGSLQITEVDADFQDRLRYGSQHQIEDQALKNQGQKSVSFKNRGENSETVQGELIKEDKKEPAPEDATVPSQKEDIISVFQDEMNRSIQKSLEEVMLTNQEIALQDQQKLADKKDINIISIYSDAD